MLNFHLSNSADRNATVSISTLRAPAAPQMGLPDAEVTFRRFLAATRETLHETLQSKHGDDYAQALIAGDPEIDMEQIGRELPRANVVYLSSKGEVLYASPKIVEVIINPDGTEKERRDPVDVPGNVNDQQVPIHWTGKKMKKQDAVRKFVFQRSIQLRHVDGLTYDFMYGMAKELHEENAMVLLGGGAKGKDPLIFHANGSPYHGFLEGRVDSLRYQLLLRLSHLELKRPA
ncbi:MAG: hypothetical protein A2289_24525 [Deltaproteobacteria bacterium RIFOXYA12_FULL_58_15]|nr:MAG: hypothetical protein A2289_24525 [Deltaproteobacteria bacterium RIFOXYA12_FULL_58_15]OGR12725.1 MAG: hypothetical protein A2341_07895 [Deltaproteobacteria bacterium RIFOXYB12_FULL_58_9]